MSRRGHQRLRWRFARPRPSLPPVPALAEADGEDWSGLPGVGILYVEPTRTTVAELADLCLHYRQALNGEGRRDLARRCRIFVDWNGGVGFTFSDTGVVPLSEEAIRAAHRQPGFRPLSPDCGDIVLTCAREDWR